MKIQEASELYQLICTSIEATEARREAINIRKQALEQTQGIVKVAFDTRRINQETEINPRRGLQNYNRSEKFISEGIQQNINTFSKLRAVLQSLKADYGKQYEWQDSYARVLLASIDKSLRIDQNDGDFTDVQPGVGSFDYLNELLFVRYRLNAETIATMTDEQIKNAILNKDDELVRAGVNKAENIISRHDVGNDKYDMLLDKLDKLINIRSQVQEQPINIKAREDNSNNGRSVTINFQL